ncbi:hypothetical protein ACFL6C_13160 [Myxococcota bacterium]
MARLVSIAVLICTSGGCGGGERCEGSFWTSNAKDLEEIQDCAEITGLLDIQGQGLTKVELPNLESVGMAFSLNIPDTLRETDFPRLKTIGGDLNIYSCNALENLDGLRDVKTVGGGLRVVESHKLVDLSGLSNLESLGGALEITANNGLTSLHGLENIDSLAGINIRENTQLINLDAIGSIAVLGSSTAALLTIESNTNLESVIFTELREIEGILLFRGNPALVNVEFEKVEAADDFGFDDNDALVSVTLPSLTSLSRDVGISRNAALSTVQLPGVTSMRGVFVMENPSLANLEMSNLASVKVVNISNNESLATTGLTALSAVVGCVEILDNDGMTQLGLPSLTSVGAWLNVSGNNVLDDLGLVSLVSVGENVEIRDNPVLPVCNVEALVAQLEAFTGNVDNSRNDHPCDPDPCPGGFCSMDCSAAEDYVCD